MPGAVVFQLAGKNAKCLEGNMTIKFDVIVNRNRISRLGGGVAL
jgi:hypothetical protein